jgi:SprT protein
MEHASVASTAALDEAMTAWCQAQAAEMGLASLAQKLTVFWNPRMRSTAGRAFWPQRRIELNPRLMAIGAAEIDRTLRHELAHLVAQERAGNRRIAAHGAEWRVACAELGIRGEKACHRLPLPRRVMTRRHAYQCPQCKTVMLRVKAIRRAVACALCCRVFSNGKYDQRFRLKKIDVPSSEADCSADQLSDQ